MPIEWKTEVREVRLPEGVINLTNETEIFYHFLELFSSDLQHHGEVEGVRAGHHGHIAPGPLVSLHRKVT